MKDLIAIGFLFIGLGFFLYSMLIVERSEQRSYDRKLMEAREFGFRRSRLNTSNRPRHRK